MLSLATGWDARLIAMASTAERLAGDKDLKDAGLTSDILYGLMRAGLPSDKLLLAQVESSAVAMAIGKASQAGIVKISAGNIEVLNKKFAAFANVVRLATPVPGSNSTYGDLLRSSGLPKDAQDKFASVYLNHSGNETQLWEEASKAGLDSAQISKLQLHGKLSFLTGNNEVVTTLLLRKALKDPIELVDKDLHDAATWKNELFAQAGILPEFRTNLRDVDLKALRAVIPGSYADEGEDVKTQFEAYTQDMADKICRAYPTHVLKRLMETNQNFKLPSAHDVTLKLLNNALSQSFNISKVPVANFLKSNPNVRGALSDTEFQIAAQQLKVVQRVYYITSDNKEMPVLMKLGATSAFDVLAYPEEQFFSSYDAKHQELYNRPAPVDAAMRIRSRANQVRGIVYKLLIAAKKYESDTNVAGLSASTEVRESVKNELIKHIPTMETLFGSMDYCECEQCRSVLSPAAYFVDLLQFVDVTADKESNSWSEFLQRWKSSHDKDYPHQDSNGRAMTPYDVLVERRPDLTQIALTCENTHTTLPYIDLVNEILEYYVANDGKLGEDAAHDTGNLTTSELVAEPQNIIKGTYDILRTMRYPINLPFDLWLETVRQFCNYFQTPLHCMLDTFRAKDDLFAPEQPFDRAAIFFESLGLSPIEVKEIFTATDLLVNDQWHELYGLPSSRINILNSSNADNKTILVIANNDAQKLRVGLAYTFFDTSANAFSKEAKILVSIGSANPQGAGQTIIKFKGLWSVTPTTGDLLACDGRAILKSAKALSRSLGVTYKEITDIVQTAFVNPELNKQSLLYKLQVGIADARLYVTKKALLQQDLSTLSIEDQNLRLKVEAFADKLAEKAKTYNAQLVDANKLAEDTKPYEVKVAELEAAITSIPFARVLVLADLDAECNFDSTTLQYGDGNPAEAEVFLRINLFVRLWRKLGWSIEDTDRALSSFMPQSAPFDGSASKWLETALIYMAHLKELNEKLKVGKQSISKLLTLWSDIATTGKNPLYAQLFLSKSVLKAVPQFDHPLGRYLSNPSTKLETHMLTLQGALGLSADEIKLILEDVGKKESDNLSLANVSSLYRYGLLAKALKLSMSELIALKWISGLNPFKQLHSAPLAKLEEDYPFSQTLEFIKVVEEVKTSGVNIEDLDYLIRHSFDKTGKYQPNRENTLAMLKGLSEGVLAIRAEHAVPKDPAALSDEVLRQKLGLVFPLDVVAKFTSMLNGTIQFTVTLSQVESLGQLHIEDFTGEQSIVVLSYDPTKKEQTSVFRGLIFESQATNLKNKFGANNKLSDKQKATFNSLVDNVKTKAREESLAFFNKYLLKQASVKPASGFLDNQDQDGNKTYDLLFIPTAGQMSDAGKQAAEKTRRTLLARTFLPYLQQCLIRQFMVQTIIAQTNADSVLLESLLTDDQLLNLKSLQEVVLKTITPTTPTINKLPKPTSLLDALVNTADRLLTATFRNAAGQIISVVHSVDADTRALDTEGKPIKPIDARSAHLEGYFEVPTAGAYRFYIEMDNKDDEAALYFSHLSEPLFLNGKGTKISDKYTLDKHLELKAGMLYRFSLDLKQQISSNAKLLVQGETLAKGPLSRLHIYASYNID